ncbi:MAG: hypothetical protein ACTSRF_16230 [Candidatus Freyarchaeota archaeon]
MNFSEMGRLYEKLAKKSMSLLRKDLKEAGYWYSSAADCYRMEGDEEKFRHLKKLALKCFSDFLKDKEKKRVMDAGQVYLWISHIYHSFGDANKFHRFAVRAAEAFSLAARRMAESDKTALQAIIGYYNSANCYRLIGDEKNAERGYRKALSIYRQKGAHKGVEFSPVLQASCYYLVYSNIRLILGCYYLESTNKKMAKKHFEEAKILPDTEKLSAPELVTQALCQMMLGNRKNAVGLAELSMKLSTKIRDYNLGQLIQETSGIIMHLAKGQRSVVEGVMASLTWQHPDLPLYDALSIITRHQTGG